MGDPEDQDETPSIPEPGTEPEPTFEDPERPAPEVTDPPGRSSEF